MHDVILDNLEQFDCPNCGEPIKSAVLEPFTTTTCPLCQSEVNVPGKFGQFLLTKRSGDGIMSVLYDAIDPKLDRNVSLKILNYVLSKNQDLVEAFKREALAAASLNAPNVLKVFEFGMHNSQPFMVMEHLQGQFLNDWVRESPHDELLVLDIVTGIVHGLAETHDAGILHGDVMPRNILITPEGVPKISDFGLARFSNQDSGFHESWSSPYYMPPERIRGEPEDHRGDMYSLGTTLFYLLCDHLPFFDLEDEVVRERKVREDAPHVLTYNPEITPEFADFTMRLLERDPVRRPRDYDSLLEELEHLRPLVEENVARQQAGEPAAYHPSQHPLSRKPRPWTMYLILVLGLIGAVIIFLIARNRNQREEQETPTPLPTALATRRPTPTPPEQVLHMQGDAPALPTAQPLESQVDALPMEPVPEPRVPATPTPTEVPAVPTPPFSLDSLPGRALFLTVGGDDMKAFQRVSTWEDQSGMGNNFRQSAPVLQPDLAPRALGPLPGLLFDQKLMISAMSLDRYPTWTLVLVAKDAGSTQGTGAPERVLIGVDPSAPSTRRMLVYADREHPGQLLFESDRGITRIGLAQDKRTQPFVLAMRRGETRDTAFVDGSASTLAGSPPPRNTPREFALPYLQMGGISGEEMYFSGFMGTVLLFDHALSDPDLGRVMRHLQDQVRDKGE